ncbi:type III toxin-antitoxin system ToxN/AbiQ family toxin [Emergencia timonensis]|uniref:type III toxin-antitoxin system ToxN/AbiQ family toxin n=1 Tax=Emergencia timonensis TaxID=1776384 RepID=UPI0039918EC4
MHQKLEFYTLDERYYYYLVQFDNRIMAIDDAKTHRPFVGVLLSINDVDYYAPLTSPKQKHQNMKNQVDFLKINGGAYGAINLNNMIPVVRSAVRPLRFDMLPCSTVTERQYKDLLLNQYRWCQKNGESIMKRAARLYELMEKRPPESLQKRCCDFKLLEEKCKLYVEGTGCAQR